MKFEIDGRTYTAEEAKAMAARGETRTDWARLMESKSMSDEEFAQAVADDPDLAMPDNWQATARVGIPAPLSQENKQQLTLRLDPSVVAYFKAGGRGWQTRINTVLQSFVRSGR